jgi:hypothetical protein
MNKPKKRIAITLIITLLLSSIVTALAVEPPTVPGKETYQTIEGILDTDEYILYPYDEINVDIGFSKYGELIDGDSKTGLSYKGVDVFANPAVPEELWCSGWIMDIHYTEGGYLRNVWAYALYSDRTASGIGGDWQQEQLTKDASDPADTNGGRRTNGYAETEDIKQIYDGPRKAIYLLQTQIYDKDPLDGGTPLVELTIQLVYNKVMKQVIEIKDVKRIDNNKMKGPFQIEFSQRTEWDIGLSSDSRSYAEFYNELPTKYYKHPFYYPEGERPAKYDLCQIIDEENLVGYAAYWPQLVSKWVTNAEEVRRYGEDVDVPCLLSSMETYEHCVSLPTSKDELENPSIVIGEDGEIIIKLPKKPVAYPRGLGEWNNAPWVFKKDNTDDYAKMLMEDSGTPGVWMWNPMYPPNGAIEIKPFQWEWGDEFCIVFKREMMGHRSQESIATECMEPVFQPGDNITSYGMYNEPDTPYVFGEWDFDLDFDHPENSTHQFRCISVYGLTDNHNAKDPDSDGGFFTIDKEVLYQLNEVFNPWDLKDVAHKDTFRWAQKGTMSQTIELESHLHDKYGNVRDCLDGEHIVLTPEKWGYYCQDSEKVIHYTSEGAILLKRGVDYEISGNTINILTGYSSGDRYKVLYSTILLPEPITIDESDFQKEGNQDYGIDVTREFHRDYVKWIFDFSEVPSLSMSAVDLIFKSCHETATKVGFDPSQPGELKHNPVMKKWNPVDGWSPVMNLPKDIVVTPPMLGSEHYEIMVPYKYFHERKCMQWALYVEADFANTSGASWMAFPNNWGIWSNPLENLYTDGICWHTGRWEWTVIGEDSHASDSLGSAMLTAAWGDWKNKETWLAGLDINSEEIGPSIPWVMRKFSDTQSNMRLNYHFDHDTGDHRSAFRDDWCTPDDWMGETIYPYAVSSADLIIVGGPIASLSAEYFNDFTDAKVFTGYGDGFYAKGCWARTTQDHYQGKTLMDVPDNELWYGSTDTEDDVGYAIISTYKDLNETVGFIVYGYTAEDTYYACYALRGGLLSWLQEIQTGTTTIILEIDYSDLHPVGFHVKECLGTFTECTGFETNFKDTEYACNKALAKSMVESEADCLGLCYKLVDIDWCAQLHPDP